MIKLTFLREYYAVICNSWEDAFERALEYLEDKTQSKSFFQDYKDLKFIYRMRGLSYPFPDIINGDTIKFEDLSCRPAENIEV